MRKLLELGLRALEPAAQQEIAAIILRQEVRDRPLDDLEPPLGQPHIGNDLGLQQGDRIAGDGIAEAGVKFFGHRRAAHDLAAFKHQDLLARPREVKSAGQAIMPAADDHGIIGRAHAAPCALGLAV